ncbi:MAG: DUF1573 domain-containing protein [Patescibacteria group bacterium]|nr:DUF1573 domain-containing protein [Patescibacteria group bacterium]
MIKKYIPLLLLAAIFLLGFLSSSILNNPGKNKEGNKFSYKDILPQEFDKILSTRKVFLVDVHIPEQKHLDGTNLVVPYNKIKENLNKFPKAKNTEIIVYCRSGRMSTEAAQALSQAGYTRVYNLIGGLNAYRESHYGVYIAPITKDLGTVIYGNIAKTMFKLINNTKEEVSIRRISTSCSCTSATVNKNTLKPYEEIEISVSFNPAVHKDNTDLGDIIRTIYIDTTSTNFSRVEASITAKVVKNPDNKNNN